MPCSTKSTVQVCLRSLGTTRLSFIHLNTLNACDPKFKYGHRSDVGIKYIAFSNWPLNMLTLTPNIMCECVRYADLRTVLYSQHNFTPDLDVQINILNILSTQFKFIAAYLDKAWKTSQYFLFRE